MFNDLPLELVHSIIKFCDVSSQINMICTCTLICGKFKIVNYDDTPIHNFTIIHGGTITTYTTSNTDIHYNAVLVHNSLFDNTCQFTLCCDLYTLEITSEKNNGIYKIMYDGMMHSYSFPNAMRTFEAYYKGKYIGTFNGYISNKAAYKAHKCIGDGDSFNFLLKELSSINEISLQHNKNLVNKTFLYSSSRVCDDYYDIKKRKYPDYDVICKKN